MKIKLLLVYLFFVSNALIYPQTYKLVAGEANATGIYVQTGSNNSAPVYTKVSGSGTTNSCYVYRVNGWYLINNTLNTSSDADYYYYWVTQNVTPMPIGTGGWSNGYGGKGTGSVTSSTNSTANISFLNGLDFTPSTGSPGTNNNPIGRFKLTGSVEGGVLQAVTISLSGTYSGINTSGVKLWSSSDNSFNPASDILLSSKSNASSVTFDSFNNLVDNSSGTYYFITVDLAASASGSITPAISNQTLFTFAGANNPSAFSNAQISSGPVSLAPPSAATTNAASNINATGATLNGTINANGVSTTVTFEYGLTTFYGTTVTADQSPVTGSSNTSVSKSITSLSAHTTYHFRVKGVSSGGTTYGLDATFATLNTAPTSSDNTVTINEDNDKTFASTDFPFYDADAVDVLVSIQITTLESAGTLFLDANNNNIDDPGEDVILNQVIITDDISKLKFRPAANGTGHPYATFQFKVNDGIAYSESSYIMSINVTPVPNLTLTNGSDYDPAPTPNTVNNPVGRFSVAADVNGSSITAITIFFAGSGTNITNVKLWSSMDAAFNFDSDIQLGTSQSYSPMVTFNGFLSSIFTSAKYYFVTFDLGASIGSITPTIANNAMITISGGTWAVDAAFIDAPLSKNPVPLPVVLQSFTAAPQNKQVLLKWSTATEVNNYGFELERAALETTSGQDGWVKIGFVEGAGNSNSPKDYSFADANPPAGKVQYRLKQIDTDGGYIYYPQTAEVNISLTGIQEKQLPKEFALGQNYPNPFNPSTVISYQLPVNGHVKLSVYNALGKEVAVLVNQEKAAGFHEVKFDASNLSAGMYIYQLRINNFLSTKKLLLIK